MKNDIDDLYVISYLISCSGDEEIVSYSSLAAKLEDLKRQIVDDDNMSQRVAESIGDYVGTDDSGRLEWNSLQNFLEAAARDNVGEMFISIQTERQGGNKWQYKFKSKAPLPILEEKLEELSERNEKLKEKIHSASDTEAKEIFEGAEKV